MLCQVFSLKLIIKVMEGVIKTSVKSFYREGGLWDIKWFGDGHKMTAAHHEELFNAF